MFTIAITVITTVAIQEAHRWKNTYLLMVSLHVLSIPAEFLLSAKPPNHLADDGLLWIFEISRNHLCRVVLLEARPSA
jgi:hypothetical protein